MQEQKLVYKCFQVARNCETCKYFDLEEVKWNQVCDTGSCEVTGDEVSLSNDCESWDFDENLLDDTFWIIKPNITGEIK